MPKMVPIFDRQYSASEQKARYAALRCVRTSARTHVQANNVGSQFDEYRPDRLIAEFGNRPEEIPGEDLRRWFAGQEWRPATCNRYKTRLSLVYRLGIENKKVKTNRATLLKRKRERNERIRFLGQVAPAKTEDEDLKRHKDEEARLRFVVTRDYPAHVPELTTAWHTGMRPSEPSVPSDQYG
jgi:hypothetical protein